MQITEQNCPTLRFIKWTSPLRRHPEFIRAAKKRRGKPFLCIPPALLPGDPEELQHALSPIEESWGDWAAAFRSDVWTASKNYRRAFDEASDAICRERSSLYADLTGEKISGCQIQRDGEDILCLLYDITVNSVEDKPFADGEPGTLVTWTGCIIAVTGDIVAGFVCGDNGMVFESAVPPLYRWFVQCNRSLAAGMLFQVLDQVAFRRCARIVTREASSHVAHSAADDDGEAVIRTTLPDVRRYDITWFTETVRTEGFPRKGYLGFRWKGPRGHQHRELVQVRATWCKGYVRRAERTMSGIPDPVPGREPLI